MADLGELVVRLRADVREFTRTMGEAGGRVEKMGKKMTDVGKKMTMGITTPILGIGITALKMSADFETSMNKVEALAKKKAGVSLQDLEDQAKQLGSTTQFSASQAADAMGFLAMAGMDTKQIYDAMPASLNLASAANIDLAKTADIASNILTGFGMEASEMGRVSDVLTATFINTNVDLEMLAETMKYAAPVANGLGISLEDTAAMAGLMGNAGIQASNAGTGLRGALTRLVKPPKDAAAALKKLNVQTVKSNGDMRPIVDILADLEAGFVGIGNAEAGKIMADIFGMQHGSKWTALLDQGTLKLGELTEELLNSGGTAERVANVQMSGLNGALKGLEAAFEGLMIAIGDTGLLQDVTKIAEKFTEFMRRLSKTNPELMKIGIIVSVVAAAIGPLIIVVGSLISAFAAIAPIVGAITAPMLAVAAAVAAVVAAIIIINVKFDSLKKAFFESSTSMKIFGVALIALGAYLSPLVAIVVGVTAAIQGIKWALTPAIESTQLFGEEVSKSTQKAVGGFMELADGAQMELMKLDINSTVITQATAEKITAIYKNMNAQVLESLKSKQAEELAILETTLSNTKELTAQEQAEILKKTKENHKQEQTDFEEKEDRIKEIMQNAAKEKRELTSVEMAELNTIREEMKESAIKTMSESEVEQLSILERMKANASEHTAAIAAEIVKNSLKAKNKSVKAAEDQYDETVQNIIKMRDETGSITEEQATKLIEEATRARDEAVKKAESMHDEVVSNAKDQAKEHVKQVNWETGEIKNKWQVFTVDVSQKAQAMWVSVSKWFSNIWKSAGEAWSGMVIVTKTKWANMQSAVSTALSDIWTTISTTFNDLVSSAYEWGSNLVTSFKDGFLNGVEAVKGAVSGVAQTIKDLIGWQSPTKEGPGSDSDKWIPNLMGMLVNGINNAIPKFKNTTNKLVSTIKTEFTKLTAVEEMFDDIKESANKMFEEMENRAKGDLNSLADTVKSALNKRQKYNEKLSDEQAKKDKKVIQEKLNNKKDELKDEQNLLKQQEKNMDVAYSNNLDQFTLFAMNKEKKRIEDNIKTLEIEIKGFEDRLNAESESYDKSLSEQEIYAETSRLLQADNQDELISLLSEYEPEWQEKGRSFADKFMDGFKSLDMQTEIGNIMKQVSDTLNMNVSGVTANLSKLEGSWSQTVDKMVRNSLKWQNEQALMNARIQAVRDQLEIDKDKTSGKGAAAKDEQLERTAAQKIKIIEDNFRKTVQSFEMANKNLGASLGMTQQGGAWYLPSGERAYNTSNLSDQQRSMIMQGQSYSEAINVTLNVDGKRLATAIGPHLVNNIQQQGVR